MIFQIDTDKLKSRLSIRPLLLIILFSLIATSLNAQSSGNLRGHVFDKISSNGLPGANVYLEGTVIGTASDIQGNFVINNIATGKHNVVISYVGYQKKIVQVIIMPNKTSVIDVAMSWDSALTTKEIVVTGQLEGQAQAINQQISSDRIVNVVSEQKIQELPDANAAESIGRLPGVAVQREGGEADKIMVRGLDPRFTNVTMNGIQIPGTDFNDRSIDLSLISQSSLAGIELYKALTADQDADAIAGTVNLITGQAKPGQKIRATFFGMYNGMTKNSKQYKASIGYSNRILENRFGMQLQVNAESRDRSSQIWNQSWNIPSNGEYTISALTPEQSSETRKRYGANLNLDFNTNDGGNIKFLNSYNKTTRSIFTSSRDYNSGGSYVTYIGEVQDINIQTFNNSLVGENYFGKFKINWALSHAYTQTNKPFDHWMRFYENETSYSGMKIIKDPSLLKQPGVNLIPYAWNNFSVADLDRSYFYEEASSERSYEGKTDIEYPLRISNTFSGFIKAGYKYRGKIRHRNGETSMTAYWLRSSYANNLDNGQIVLKNWSASDWPDGYTGKLTDYLQNPIQSIMVNNQYLLNPLLSEKLVRDWYNFNKNGISKDGSQYEYIPQLGSLSDYYNVNENINSAYIMAKIDAGKIISFIAGIRIEDERNIYNAYFVPYIIGEFTQSAPIRIDTTISFKDDYWFPNFHLKIIPFEWWNIMMAITKTIARPDFSMRLPQLTVDTPNQHIYAGNPDLQPAISWNFDISSSFYASKYGLFTISAFRKNIENMFYMLNNIVLVNKQQARDMGLPVDKYGPWNQYTVDMPYNTSGTKVWGIEFELQTHLSFLPGVLQNIVVSANYSRTWSSTQYPRFKVLTSSTVPPIPPQPVYYYTQNNLTGQTSYMENISIGYDYKGFSGRISGYLQGPYLNSINNLAFLDTYEKSFSRWDVSLKQSILDYLSVFVNVNNIFNTIDGSYSAFRNLDLGGSIYGLSAEMGVKVDIE